MTNKKRLLAITLLAASASAGAYFDVKEDTTPPPQPARVSSAQITPLPVGITQVGVGASSLVKGRVIDTRLSDSLPLLIPKGWRVSIAPGMSGKLISWSGGKPWAEVLDGSLRKVGMAGEINWLTHRISISGAGSVPQQAVKSSSSKTVSKSGVRPSEKSWQVHSGKSVDEILTTWTKSEGWNLESNVNLIVMADATLKGNLKTAVLKFIQALNTSRASSNRVLKAKFYAGNNYLRVWEERK